MKAREVQKALERRGAVLERQRGSHAFYRYGGCTTVLAVHNEDVKPGTLRAIEADFEPCFGKRWLTRPGR